MAKQGFYGGDPDRVRRARVDDVVNVLGYTSFLNELEDVVREMNKE